MLGAPPPTRQFCRRGRTKAQTVAREGNKREGCSVRVEPGQCAGKAASAALRKEG